MDGMNMEAKAALEAEAKTTRHTPGPWLTVPDNYVAFDVGGLDGTGRVVWAEPGGDIAYVMADGHPGNENAALIAAAPELLEAVQYLIDELWTHLPEFWGLPPKGSSTERSMAVAARAKAVIAKATGTRR